MAASPTSQSTGLLAPGTFNSVYIGKNIINGAIAQPGTTVTVYDSLTAGSGNIILQIVNASTSSIDHMVNIGIRCDIGISITVTGGTGANVYFGGN